MAATRSKSQSTNCLCGSNRLQAVCCEPLLAGEASAHHPEQLMRSRYCAFVQGLEPYLLATWHPKTRPATLDLDAEPAVKWTGLTVLNSQADSEKGTVEFVARYKLNGRAMKLHEKSRFICEHGTWYYVDGEFVA